VTVGKSTLFVVSGTHLVSGVVLVYTTPKGETGTLKPSLSQEPNSTNSDAKILSFTAAASQVGTYAFYVKNPDGQTSGRLIITAVSALGPASVFNAFKTIFSN
jgi:hypothetical protein